MNGAHTFSHCRLTALKLHCVRYSQLLHYRYPLLISPVPIHARCMGSHGTPAHWKSMKQICLENKNHMNCLPVPEGNWQENYTKQQKKWNIMLLSSVAALGVTVFALYKSGSIYLHSFDYRGYKSLIAESLQAASAGKEKADSQANAKASSLLAPKDEKSPSSQGTEAPAEQLNFPEHAQYMIIGAGTAAFGAFRAIKARDPKAKILVVGEENSVPYMRPPLSKELWFNEDKAEVENMQFRQWNGKKRSVYYEPQEFFADPKKLETLPNGGIALIKGKRVVKLDAGNKAVWLSSGEKITYDKCLIATGGKPRNIPVLANASPEVRARTVLYRNIEDFRRLSKIVETAGTIAIVGGGFLGSELACALGKLGQKTGLKVFQIFPEKGNMGNVLPEYLSKWATRKVEKEGVKVLPEQTITDVTFKNEKVVLTTDSGKDVGVDCVVAAVGLEANVDLARSSNLEIDPINGGFLVNAELEARRDLWVAGDAACFYDVKLGRRRVEHHDHAVVSGRLAGENMTGAAKPYWHQSMFWSDLGPDVGYEAIGIVDSSLKTVAVFAKASESDTPKAVVEATGDNLRSETKTTTKSKKESVKKTPLDTEDYGKGVVFYLNNKKTVVGILLWNTFNKMAIARQILRDGARNEDLYEVAKLFDLYDTAVAEEEEAVAS